MMQMQATIRECKTENSNLINKLQIAEKKTSDLEKQLIQEALQVSIRCLRCTKILNYLFWLQMIMLFLLPAVTSKDRLKTIEILN